LAAVLAMRFCSACCANTATKTAATAAAVHLSFEKKEVMMGFLNNDSKVDYRIITFVAAPLL